MPHSLTYILGGNAAPARSLAARMVAHPDQRVVLVDHVDPVAALLAEREPMLGLDAPGLPTADWRRLVDEDRVSGAAIDRDAIPWMVGTLGLLRPSRLLLCVSLPELDDATRTPAIQKATLAMAMRQELTAIDQYFRLLEGERSPTPRLVITVHGASGSGDGQPMAHLLREVVSELLRPADEPPFVLLLPRLLGAGPRPDPQFLSILRFLLMGEPVRLPADAKLAPYWASMADAACLVERLFEAGRASSAAAESMLGGAGGDDPYVLGLPGVPATLAYVAGVMANELDRLLGDPLLLRASLVRADSVRGGGSLASAGLAVTIRSAVRWHSANASLLARALA